MCNCEIKNTRLKALSDTMNGIINQYDSDTIKKYELDKEIEELIAQLEGVKSETMNIVLNEKDTIGRPKYGSDEKRRTAQNQYLQADSRYQPIKNKLRKLIDEREQTKTRLELGKLRIKQSEFNLNIETQRRD
jgi:multidrug resistance efflux pump